jgi:hypothetical protein
LKSEGRKSLAERSPELIEAARKLNDGRSLREISAALRAGGSRISHQTGKAFLGNGGQEHAGRRVSRSKRGFRFGLTGEESAA